MIRIKLNYIFKTFTFIILIVCVYPCEYSTSSIVILNLSSVVTFTTAPPVGVTPRHKIILLLHNYNFVTIMILM